MSTQLLLNKVVNLIEENDKVTRDDFTDKEWKLAKGEIKEKKGKAVRAKKDPDAPKRARSAYIFFQSDYRPKLKVEQPDLSFGDVTKVIASKWNDMSEKEKQPFFKMAEEDKVRYGKESAEFNDK